MLGASPLDRTSTRSDLFIEHDKDCRAEFGIDMQRFFVATALLRPRATCLERHASSSSTRNAPFVGRALPGFVRGFPSLLSLSTERGEGTPGLNQTVRCAGYSYWS